MAATHTSPATTGIYEEADRCWRLLTPHANVPEATSATSDGHATEVKQMSTSLRCDPSPTEEPLTHQKLLSLRVLWPAEVDRIRPKHRSEEHTSELQSLRHLVCRLLLEK